MTKFKLLLFLFCIIFIQWDARSQGAKKMLEIANSAELNQSDFYKEITFEDRFGYFVIPVRIGNDTYQYIFDTGGYNTITSPIKAKNTLSESFQVEVGSANQIKKEVTVGLLQELSLDGLAFNNVGVFNFDFDDSPKIACYTNGGLIGKGVIKEAVWQIDYQDKVIRIADDVSKLDHLDKAIRLKVRLDKTYNPFIKVKINGKTKELMLDYGFGGFVSFTDKSGKAILKNPAVKINGEGAIGANGASEDPLFYSLIDQFEIGGRTFSKQVGLYSKPNNYDLIGSGISKYFIVTLNFKDKELYLTPYDNIEEEGYATFGFDLSMDDSGIYVNRLHQGGEAFTKGMKLGDRVISVNGESPDAMEFCDFYFHMRRLFKSNDDIKLLIEREGGQKELVISKGSNLN